MIGSAPLRCQLRFSPGARQSIAIGVLLLAIFRANCDAQQATSLRGESLDQLSEDVNDPTASLTQVQVKEEYTPAQYGTNAQPNTVLLRSLLAVRPHGPMDLEQIIRPTLSLVTIARGKGASTRTEFGDTEIFDLFVMPWPDLRTTGFRWGFGPYLIFPTASSSSAGEGAWQAGPAAAFTYRGIQHLMIAALIQQATSFAYTSPDRPPITSLSIQPMLSYQLGWGWYAKSSDATWKFNLRHATSTTIPLSAGIGKVWKLDDGTAINFAIAGEWMVYRQFTTQTEQFGLKFQVTLLLPQVQM
jgi:hypothetical protein